MRPLLDAMNWMWPRTAPQRGKFDITQFPADKSWGWVFKPEEPVLDNSVGFESGYQTADEALQALKVFVTKRVKIRR